MGGEQSRQHGAGQPAAGSSGRVPDRAALGPNDLGVHEDDTPGHQDGPSADPNIMDGLLRPVGEDEDGRLIVGEHWRKGELIGRGSFGSVYLGMNLESGGMFVIKSVNLLPNRGDTVSEEVKQLEQEIAMLRKLRHPNIVRYLGSEVNQADNEIMVFLEYMSGGSVSEQLQKFGAFDDVITRKYTREVLLGLQFLHSHGILHRDIKGQNILVNRGGVCKIADFGACKSIGMDTQQCSLKGTPVFMAPEVISKSMYSRAADVWSLGCTVIEMATAAAPFSQFSNPVAAILHISQSTELPQIPDEVSPATREFIFKCLVRDVDQRPSCESLLKDKFVMVPSPSSASKDAASADVTARDGHSVSSSGPHSPPVPQSGPLGDMAADHAQFESKSLFEIAIERGVAVDVAEVLCCIDDSVVASDPNLEDCPIVFSSPGFSQLTGYHQSEILGLNCRFLQGPDTDPVAVGQISQLIQMDTPGRVRILNYHKNGKTFHNSLVLMPVHDENGETALILGFQSSIQSNLVRDMVTDTDRTLVVLTSDALEEPNGLQAAPFSSDVAKGSMLLLAATTSTVHPNLASYFSNRNTLTELQVQFTLVHPISGPVYFGLELDGKVKRATIQELLLRMCMIFQPNLHISRGHSTRNENAHIVAPLLEVARKLTATPPGETPPELGCGPLPSTKFAAKPKQLKVGWTYTMSFETATFDVINWCTSNVSGVRSQSLASLLSNRSIHVVGYSVPNDSKYHGSDQIQRLFDFELLHKSIPKYEEFMT